MNDSMREDMREQARERSAFPWSAAPSGDDVMRAHRNRMFQWLALAIIVLLTPFGVNHFLQGRILVGLAVMGVIAVLAVNAIAIRRNREPPISPAVVFVPLAAAIWSAIVAQGVNAALWTYPSVLLAHYTLPRRVANIVSGILTGLFSALVFVYVAPDTAARIFATLLLTIIFANIFLGTVERLAGQLQALAIADPLTGTFNRRHMDTSLGRAVAIKDRHGTPASLLLLDIDHFKRINDAFGHATGDEVLKRVAATIAGSLRETDMLFRIGGEEFAVLLPETVQASALQAAEKLRATVAAADLSPKGPVTSSVGVAELGPGEDSHGVLKRCDDALYQAKTQGRNLVCAAAPFSTLPRPVQAAGRG